MIVYADELFKRGCITHIIPKRFTEQAIKGEFKINPGLSFKPTGLWLSWNHGWQHWCKYEEFLDIEDYDQLNVELELTLKFWLIDSKEDFNELWLEYSKGYKTPHSFNTEFATSLIDLMEAEKQLKINFWDWPCRDCIN